MELCREFGISRKSDYKLCHKCLGRMRPKSWSNRLLMTAMGSHNIIGRHP